MGEKISTERYIELVRAGRSLPFDADYSGIDWERVANSVGGQISSLVWQSPKRKIAEALGYQAHFWGPGYALFDPNGKLVGPSLLDMTVPIPHDGVAATPEQAWEHFLHYVPDFEVCPFCNHKPGEQANAEIRSDGEGTAHMKFGACGYCGATWAVE